jgi:hypothetical protein
MILLQETTVERGVLFAFRTAVRRNSLRICKLAEYRSQKAAATKCPRMTSLQNRRNKQPGMTLLQKKVGGPPPGCAKVYLQDELLRGNKVPLLGRTFVAKPTIRPGLSSRANIVNEGPLSFTAFTQVEPRQVGRWQQGLGYFPLPSSPLPTGSANSLSYAAVSEGTHSISGMSKPGGCNRTENLSMATQGFVYILGSSIVTLICK